MNTLGVRRPTPIVIAILATLVVSFVVVALVVRFAEFGPGLYEALRLDPAGVLDGRVWTLVTYALLHDLVSPMHLVWNGLLLFFFGPELEERWGRNRFVLFLVLTILGGGLGVMTSHLLGLSSNPVVGASAFVEGLMVAWGLTFRDRTFLMMFVLPMRGIHMVWLAVGLGVLDAVSFGPVSASAHFGGMAMAALLVLGVWRTNKIKLVVDDLLVKLGLRKKARLTIVPPPRRGGPDDYVH